MKLIKTRSAHRCEKCVSLRKAGSMMYQKTEITSEGHYVHKFECEHCSPTVLDAAPRPDGTVILKDTSLCLVKK